MFSYIHHIFVVSFQVTFLTRLLATHTTYKLFLSSVYSLYVCSEVMFKAECFTAFFTFVWFLSCMDPHVCDQVAAVTKLLATHTTHKLLLSFVYSLYVCSEVTPLAECFTACFTLVWFFSSVYSDVFSEAAFI